MPAINILNSFETSGQFPLDSKIYFNTLAELQDLGTSDFKAFTYYEDMEVICVENHTKYIWREVEGSETGLITPNFTYPANVISEGIDYSNRIFNFFAVQLGGADAVFNSSLDENLEMPVSIGGLAAGTTIGDLNGLTFTQYVELKDFPTIDASITDFPNFTQTGFDVSNVEVGTSYSPSLSIGFNQGNINNGDGTSAGNLVGNLSTVNVATPSNPNAFQDLSVSSTPVVANVSAHILTIGPNLFTISGTNSVGTTTYTNNKGQSDTITEIENAKNDTIPDNLIINKSAFYYAYSYLGNRNTSPTSSASIRALLEKTFLNITNTGNFTINIPANTSEYSLYLPENKTVSIIDTSTFSELATSPISVVVNDAAGNPVNYEYIVVDMGLSGFPQSTVFNITIT